MTYKDPERKRQWEQEHREQRNARRRTQRLAAGSGQPAVPKSTSGPRGCSAHPSSRASARPWFRSETARHLESNSWLGGRHLGSCCSRRSPLQMWPLMAMWDYHPDRTHRKSRAAQNQGTVGQKGCNYVLRAGGSAVRAPLLERSCCSSGMPLLPTCHV
jgi:hypothetical protein